jgi:signal transduction histidine kinase
LIVLLDTDGRIVAANEPWRAAFAQQHVSAGEAGGDYASALAQLLPGLDAGRLRERIHALAAHRTDEVTTTPPSEGALNPLLVRIQRLDEGPRTLLVATHANLGGMAQAEEALQQLEDQLAGARSAERGRFAEQLAELTGPHLDALRRNLARLRAVVEGERAADTVARMEGSLREAMAETANFAALMHPAALDEGLIGASRKLAQEFAAGAGVRLRYRASGDVDAAPRPAQEAAFRVLQEALSNVYRHAAAGMVSVTLAARDGALHLRVSDDGKGLPPGEASLGVGIPGMRTRAAQLGGAVEVIGRRRGVVVLAHLPYEAAASGV